jgi:hypothetical protein
VPASGGVTCGRRGRMRFSVDCGWPSPAEAPGEYHLRRANRLPAQSTGMTLYRGIILQDRDATGNMVDPVRPTDAAELRVWVQSEGVWSYVTHGDLVDKHEGGSVLELWKEIQGHQYKRMLVFITKHGLSFSPIAKDRMTLTWTTSDEERTLKTASTASFPPHLPANSSSRI